MSKRKAVETPSVDQLVEETRVAFEFLRENHGPPEVELIWPDSGKGGFVLTYQAAASVVEVRYLDTELVVERDGRELFGASRPGSFAGNMFSRQNLLLCVSQIARDVAAAIYYPSCH